MNLIVTIDGPAGSGKSATAREVARRLNLPLLPTGLMYRSLTSHMIREGILVEDYRVLREHARIYKFAYEMNNEQVIWPVLQTGCPDLHGLSVGARVATVAADPEVHAMMAGIQRRIARSLGQVVTEGRDQGSYVFPAANVKVYLNAPLQIRAARRRDDMIARSVTVSFEAVASELNRRDKIDRGRIVGPLTCPCDALCIDTGTEKFDDVVQSVATRVAIIRAK